MQAVHEPGVMDRVKELFLSPLRCGFKPLMRTPGDWIATAGILLYMISVFFLPWITIGAEVLGIEAHKESYGLFVSPWAWLLVVVFVVLLGGLWFVQTRGAILLGGGIFCLVFNLIFFIGAWKKINAIIGDIVRIAKAVPFIGELLGELVSEAAKRVLIVDVAAGFYVFMAAGVLLVLGGALRLASGPRLQAEGELEALLSQEGE